MNRRAFVTGLGAVLAAPLAADGQQPNVPTIGVVSPQTASAAEGKVMGLPTPEPLVWPVVTKRQPGIRSFAGAF